MAQPYKPWTKDEDIYLVLHRQSGIKNCVDIAEAIGRTVKAVEGRIARFNRRPWTNRENDYIRDHAEEYSVPEIAAKIFRTADAISVQMAKLGVSRRHKDGWYTALDVAHILGTSEHWVVRRVERGALPAQNHRRVQQQWRIPGKALKYFLRSYPTELDDLVKRGCKPDMLTIIDILAGIRPKINSTCKHGRVKHADTEDMA